MRFFASTPARVWRAFFLLATLSASAVAGPNTLTPAPLRQIGAPDTAEAREALDTLRHLGIAGSYFLEFDLRILPRRGEEQRISGRMWGTQGERGPLVRVELGQGPTAVRLLIQRGPEPAVWRYGGGAAGVEKLGVAALFQPLMPGTDLTVFDLEMPYIYWNDFTYQGLVRYNGRPTHVITLRPPAEFAKKYPGLAGVRVKLDTQYSAPVQTELLGSADAATKTITIVDLRKVGEQWLVKTIDARDEVSRNKTRLIVLAAALNLEFSPTLFEPAQLTEAIRPPAVPLTQIGL